MSTISETNLRRVDLNNLLVFTALMRERSVTRAAERLFLGQPAVSLGLKRLRELFKDELFVRTRGGMEPTARAIELHAGLHAGLAQIQQTLFTSTPFDPAQAETTLRLGLPDDLEMTLAPALLDRMARDAPRVQLVLRPADVRQTPATLDQGEVDVALTSLPRGLKGWHRHEVLLHEHFLCVYSPRRIGAIGRMTLKRYLALPQVLVSATGDTRGAVDVKLEELGHQRRVALAVSRFSSLPLVLEQCEAIANVPSAAARLFAQRYGLATCALPFESPRFPLAMVWHARADSDPALAWMRRLLAGLVLAQRPAAPARRR